MRRQLLRRLLRVALGRLLRVALRLLLRVLLRVALGLLLGVLLRILLRVLLRVALRRVLALLRIGRACAVRRDRRRVVLLASHPDDEAHTDQAHERRKGLHVLLQQKSV